MSNTGNWKRKIGLAVCAAALLALAACGQPDGSATEQSASPSGVQAPATAGTEDAGTGPDTPASSSVGGDSSSSAGSSGTDEAGGTDADGKDGTAAAGNGSGAAGGGQSGQEGPAKEAGAARLLPPLEDTVAVSQGIAYVTNASAVEVIVNKQRNLPADYEPDDLVVPDIPFSFSGDDPKKQLRKEAAEAIEQLFAAAKKDGIELAAVSGYRSYSRQKAIFEANAKAKGEEEANRTSAYPGQSEHQTGLAMDVSSKSVNYALEESFGETEEGKWLAEHAHEYGFIIRYPKGKEEITGYSYEPWHIRYVGKELAAAVYESGLTLEEFAERQSVPVSTGK